jgi:hypothetical protein
MAKPPELVLTSGSNAPANARREVYPDVLYLGHTASLLIVLWLTL